MQKKDQQIQPERNDEGQTNHQDMMQKYDAITSGNTYLNLKENTKKKERKKQRAKKMKKKMQDPSEDTEAVHR